MADDFGNIVARTHLHSCYVARAGYDTDAIVVSEIIENERGETKPNLKVFKNPKVSFWLTQTPFRDHTDKKEFESLRKLDEYTVHYKDKDAEIFKALNNYYPRFMTPDMRREIYQNPYLYGGNISLEALVASAYKRNLLKQDRTPHAPTTGFFDIEQSLLPGSYGKLPMMVFTSENRVFFTMKKSFMYEPRDGKSVAITVEDVEKAAHEIIDPLVNAIFDDNKDLVDYKKKLPFTYEFHVGETEVEMIRWIFGKMHETKTSFIGVWNLGFDMGEIIKILEEENIPLSEIFADPSFQGQGHAYASYREDKRKVHHFTQKWHWLSNTAYFQFVDSMALYSYIRMVDGKEASYALDDILKKFNLGGKLKIDVGEDLSHLQTADWHRVMLSKYFTAYCVYAMWDGIALQMLEWLNNDLTAMVLLGDITPGRFFVNQTIRVTNTLFQDWMPEGGQGKVHGGHVLGTGVDIEGLADHELESPGGAVLEPQNLVARGLALFQEWPNHTTRCYAWQSDLDFSAQYPNNIAGLNISKQTKVGTILSISGKFVNPKYRKQEGVEVLCSYLITPSANGIELGTDFFGLPGPDEMNDLFEERLRITGR
jgi:hypothetical protein